ncbi:hypothetical protein ACWODI_07520 [Facklamia languida]|uniref:Uncharacterized protein n=1 Tax=Facklamia languida CCUG 37842 TaxID=883113 RepID=H3NIR0_9LACT|nr:hypothetical protein [Facklamia languida]EHR37188.1 hypothetical protein HMPREF9708_00749 [Facklamia languida CCUG 37842]
MGRLNLYIHYDVVTNYFMTRGIDLTVNDFAKQYMPQNIILANAPEEFGRYDVQTDFKILRGQDEVVDYFDLCHKEGRRLSNWIDFDSIEMMHQLAPFEISELLYLFHASKALRSPFFYKLQNNYVYLTMPNGLNKTYYRHMTHFYPRFQRALSHHMTQLMNENRAWFHRKEKEANRLPLVILEAMSPLFVSGLKVDFKQADRVDGQWFLPLYIIEDELTNLTRNLSQDQSIGSLSYQSDSGKWDLVIKKLESDDVEEIE